MRKSNGGKMRYNRGKTTEEKTPGGKRRSLTARQEKYCQARAAGKGYREAYTSAGYSAAGTDETITRNAYAMERERPVSTDILARIKALKEDAAAGLLLDREARAAYLARVAMDSDAVGTKDRLRAVDMLNRMAGDYSETVRTEISGAVEVDRRTAFSEYVDALK